MCPQSCAAAKRALGHIQQVSEALSEPVGDAYAMCGAFSDLLSRAQRSLNTDLDSVPSAHVPLSAALTKLAIAAAAQAAKAAAAGAPFAPAAVSFATAAGALALEGNRYPVTCDDAAKLVATLHKRHFAPQSGGAHGSAISVLHAALTACTDGEHTTLSPQLVLDLVHALAASVHTSLNSLVTPGRGTIADGSSPHPAGSETSTGVDSVGAHTRAESARLAAASRAELASTIAALLLLARCQGERDGDDATVNTACVHLDALQRALDALLDSGDASLAGAWHTATAGQLRDVRPCSPSPT